MLHWADADGLAAETGKNGSTEYRKYSQKTAYRSNDAVGTGDNAGNLALWEVIGGQR